MRLYNLKRGDLARVAPEGEEFVVMHVDQEDRVSGMTHILYLSGRSDDFAWDRANPEVIVTGHARIDETIRLTFDDGTVKEI